MRLLVLLLSLSMLAACATDRPDAHLLDRTLYAYAGAIRWGDIDAAAGFIDPEVADDVAWNDLERQRFEQLRVSRYDVRGKEQVTEHELVQLVEIEVVNQHTQTARQVVDRQRWRWDAEAERWWLVSGLPDFAPR